MEAVILAAGKGTRFDPISKSFPKPLTRVGNKSNLTFQLEYLKKSGVKKCFIVISEKTSAIKDAIGTGKKFDISIEYAIQEKPLGIAHALGLLEKKIHSPFVVLLGDIFFIPNIQFNTAFSLINEPQINAILGTTWEKDIDAVKKNYTILTSNPDAVTGKVIEVEEKPLAPATLLKGNGIYFFKESIFEAIKKTPLSKIKKEYEITTAIAILIKQTGNIYHSVVCDWDINITFPKDIWLTNMRYLQEIKNGRSIISSSATIHPQARIINSVIEDHVQIHQPTVVQNSVIAANTVLKNVTDVTNSIHFPHWQMSFE